MTDRAAGFHVSRASDASWTADDGDSPFVSRDLGLEMATGGRFAADVSRATGHGKLEDLHSHMLDFQIVYVLEGTATFWYEGEGEVTFAKGDFVHQPPGIAHRVVTVSPDCELLQVTAPADYETVDAGAS